MRVSVVGSGYGGLQRPNGPNLRVEANAANQRLTGVNWSNDESVSSLKGGVGCADNVDADNAEKN